MPDIKSLASRIDAEFSAVAKKTQQFQAQQLEEYKARQKRLEKLATVFDELREIWKPRLEMLVQKFGDRVQATPRIHTSTREVSFEFQSNLARVRLRFSATTDRDVRKVILSYDLEIIPALMRFEQHAELEFPIDAVDKEAVAKWFDDRIVQFVQTYFAVGANDMYLKDDMVEDPVAHVQFARYAAGATLEWQGRTFYFIGDETRESFAKEHGIALA